MYGALVWGVLPIRPGVSWETHLAAAIIGIALAFALRALDVPPKRRYSWEEETHAATAERPQAGAADPAVQGEGRQIPGNLNVEREIR
jgi:hypothetical protein